MSETNNATPEELVEEIEYEIEQAEVIPTPIDPTLTIAGEAADAKATGDAIRGIASAVKVNNQTADASGNITVYGNQILMSEDTGAQDIAAAIEAVEDRTAADILYDSEESKTIADVFDEVTDALTDGVTDAEIDEMVESAFEEEEEE